MKKERQPGPDLCRLLAMALVVVIHAASYSGAFPERVEVTGRWLALLYFQRLSHVCVPLFLLLTGYFGRSTKADRRYYGGLVRLGLSYLVVGVLCVAARMAAGVRYAGVWEAALTILNFTADEYGWYAEMYVGLFLLIPFLNLLWDGLETPKRRGALLVTLAVMTLLPETVKSFRIVGFTPNVVPDWWEQLYPLTYFFLGAWLRDREPKLRTGALAALALGLSLVPWGTAALYSLGGEYGWFCLNSFQDLFTAGTAVCLFCLLRRVRRLPRPLARGAAALAGASFEYYLLSFLTDQFAWRHLSWPAPLKLAAALALPVLPALALRWVSGKAADRLRAKPQR